ncbi:signal peptidase II [candidate division KSB1 bacterium]|nr:signal peptidase II [candidate division KSB1 bacterium]MBL7094685.1 signal peptidase II [candidate division KSB1 bacterium]
MFKSNLKLLSWSAIIVLLDQVTKKLVSSSIIYGDSISILGDFLRFTYIKNPGMAFGIQVGNRYVFTAFSLIASLVILVYLFRLKPENFWARFALASILGGAIGNLIDRIVHKEVIDFIDIRIIRWPVFNVADIAVTLGMILLIAFVIFDNKELEPEEEHSEAN